MRMNFAIQGMLFLSEILLKLTATTLLASARLIGGRLSKLLLVDTITLKLCKLDGFLALTRFLKPLF